MDNTEDIVVRRSVAALSEQERAQWLSLFERCYKKDRDTARAIFRKYELHPGDAWFCIGRNEGEAVACYSGLALPFGRHRVFLATDTMSDGRMRNATVKLAGVLYGQLREAGVGAVCGFPNQNIVKIREQRLGWKMQGQLHLYVGVPWLWRLGRRLQSHDLWDVRRPPEGFFSPRRPFLTLAGRHGLQGDRFSAVLTLSSTSPGPFFIKVPQALAAPKRFGWVMTDSANADLALQLESASGRLDLNTIDVP